MGTPCPRYPTAVGAFEFGMDGADQCQHLAVGQALAVRRATALTQPDGKSIDDIKHLLLWRFGIQLRN